MGLYGAGGFMGLYKGFLGLYRVLGLGVPSRGPSYCPLINALSHRVDDTNPALSIIRNRPQFP